MTRLRLLLAILALALGLAAAIAGTPVRPGHANARPALYRPPSGC